jgi:hypothetical protein
MTNRLTWHMRDPDAIDQCSCLECVSARSTRRYAMDDFKAANEARKEAKATEERLTTLRDYLDSGCRVLGVVALFELAAAFGLLVRWGVFG